MPQLSKNRPPFFERSKSYCRGKLNRYATVVRVDRQYYVKGKAETTLGDREDGAPRKELLATEAVCLIRGS